MADKENPSTTLFREYIRIKSVQPSPDYPACMEFLKVQAAALGLPYKITSCVEDKPIFIMTWEGKDTSLTSVLLNSHTDVVPVFPEYWTYEPFSAFKDDAGNIYGRGTQDMKCVGIQHLEAIRRIKVTYLICNPIIKYITFQLILFEFLIEGNRYDLLSLWFLHWYLSEIKGWI